MKYVIASDIHGSAYYCRLLKERYLQEGAQKLILLGDLLYHGARNALPRDYSTLETAAILNSLKEHIVCVRGNCDSEVDGMVLEFPVTAAFALLPAGGRTLILTHGHNEYAHLSKNDVSTKMSSPGRTWRRASPSAPNNSENSCKKPPLGGFLRFFRFCCTVNRPQNIKIYFAILTKWRKKIKISVNKLEEKIIC